VDQKLRTTIIEELKLQKEYGLFFPPTMAFFAYNETIGQDNLPLTKEEALKQGFRWEEYIPATKGQETLKPEQIPDHIKDVTDGILKETLVCISCCPQLSAHQTGTRNVPSRIDSYSAKMFQLRMVAVRQREHTMPLIFP